jgi:multiple sugar transport system substrate-binding protein
MMERKEKEMRKLIVFIAIATMVLAACSPAATPTAPAAPAAPTSAPAVPTSAPAIATAAPQATAPQATAVSEQPQATALPPTKAAPPGATQITFWSWVPDIQTQVDEWNATHTDIWVNYVNPGNGNTEYTKLNTALQANSDIPDVVQIEYQHVPNYIAQDALLNLVDYGANDVKSKFIPWTWAQVSQGAGVYAYPQDAGPMVLFCNTAVLDKYSVKIPTTWDEFSAAATKIHQADPKVYLSNYTADQGWFFGLLWQSGAQPFVVNGKNITINFTSPEVNRVIKLWGDMMKAGVLSPVDTYTNDWQTTLGNGTVACWQAGAWGTFISTYSPDYKGKWKVALMPQWTAGGQKNGNYGGSTIAVTKVSQHPKEAAAFDQWLNTDGKITLELTNPDKAGLFPITQDTLKNKDWSDVKYDFWSGDAIHQVMAQAAQQVDPNFGWSPFTNFVYTTYADDLTKVKAGQMTFEDAMKDLQDKSVAYAKDQGFTVTNP